MSSIQERLQLKRVPLDTWNIREQLCLASAVVRSGDQNWMSVSRALKTVGEPNRPPDWYSQKSCAAQYGALLEHVETPKRKKRCSEGAVETPQESILKRLTQERIVEIQKTLAEMHQQYDQLKTEISEVRNPSTPEDRLRDLWSSIEASKRARERENARRAAWLKEREERRARVDRTWRPPQPTTPTSQAPVAAPAPPSSPLLTSLLKSSPVVTTPQHISHPANSIETVSPSATAPTLSMLLEKPTPSTGANQHESKHAAIEHIKSQLVQIEQQLIANTSASPVPLPPAAPSVDIDDIEIKAEDVYAFRDIDIHIPPVTTMHKTNTRVLDKSTFKKEDDQLEPAVENKPIVNIEEVIKEEPMSIDMPEDAKPTQSMEQAPPLEKLPEVEEVLPVPEAPEVKIAFPDAFVKFPTTEIKVIQEELKIKEEFKEPEPQVPEPETVTEEAIVHVEEEPHVDVVEVSEPAVEDSQPPSPGGGGGGGGEQLLPGRALPPDLGSIPLPPDPDEDKPVEVVAPEPEVIPEPETELLPEETQEPKQEEEPEQAQEEKVTEEIVEEEVKKVEVHDEDSMPLKEMIRDILPVPPETEPRTERLEVEDARTETDDDTPMELSREEEKDGKKRRDYSRKKKSDSRTCSGSESAAEAEAEAEAGAGAGAEAPQSPAGDAERQHRLWKKSVMLVYSRLCAHKYASLFLRPISDEEAPGYSTVIKRPMDLTLIRRNIDNGVIRTTAEFQRDVLLMLSNALMYNSSEHSVYAMAKEMHEEAACQLGMLLAAQAHAGLAAPPARRKRRRQD